MRKGIERFSIDAEGILGAYLKLNLGVATIKEATEFFESFSVTARINALRKNPELIPLANELKIQCDHVYRCGTKPTVSPSKNGRRTVKFPEVSELEKARFEISLMAAEQKNLRITAIKIIEELSGLRKSKDKRLCKLNERNEKIQEAKEWAQDFANKKWASDKEKKIRIGDMAEMIWSAIVDTEHASCRPETVQTIRSWIIGAPEYASKSGRRRKNR